MLKAQGIGKMFPGGARALRDVSFSVAQGEVLTLLGPSGCGKSTLLRIVAGLEDPTEGELSLDGLDLAGVPAGHRDVGFVFQSYALYPHLTVRGNLSLALKARGASASEISGRVDETAGMLGLAALSGGQQQRVALGRALVRRPRLFLLDEPLSNLDALLREEMRSELRALFRRLQATVIYVTHDQAEAMSLSDRVLVLENGSVRQCAPPLELYARPADVFTATFVGGPRMTLWNGVIRNGFFQARGVEVMFRTGASPDAHATIGIRPEDVRVSAEPLENGHDAQVALVEPTGERVLLTLKVGGGTLRAFAAAREWPGQVYVELPPERIHLFEAASGRRLP